MISLICTRLMLMVMDPIHAVDLLCQININWPYCNKSEKDRFESDSEGELCGRLEES